MHDDMIVAFRDAKGIRPLAFGSFADNYGYAIASETCGLDIIGAEYEREIRPGEMLIITAGNYIESVQLAEPEYKLDIFEMVYFARHDSILYGERVNEIRRRLGEALALEHPELMNRLSDPLVVPIPDTSVPAAEGYAESLGVPHRSAIIKNRYIGRTFLSPSHHQRNSQLKRKHSVIPEALAGRDVILIDDSIVRGNTMPRLVQQVRALGARSVSVLIASPPVRFPDFYGIDTPEQSELMAFSLTPEQMRREIDADYLGFLSLSGLISATNQPYDKFNLSCFNGEYSIDIGENWHKIDQPVSMEYIDV
jgi:amidophosphoribosyltransferase